VECGVRREAEGGWHLAFSKTAALMRFVARSSALIVAPLAVAAVAIAQGVDRLPPIEPLPSALPVWEAPVDEFGVQAAAANEFGGASHGVVQATPVYAPGHIEQIDAGPPLSTGAIYPDVLMSEPAKCGPGRIPDFKSGFFQKLRFTGTWIPSFDETDVGFSDFEAVATFAAPLPTTDWPILISPKYVLRFLDGPSSPDLPSQLHDASIEFRWLPKLTDRLRLALAIEPGVHTDFEANDADAFRTPGHAVAIYDWSPTRQLVIGAMYLDREDIDIMPAGGLILRPSDDWQFDLVFPFPKIASRLWADGKTEFWHYVAAEFGSGPYSIRRADGRQDVIILSDYRLLYGLERKQLGGIWSRVEAGYVFGREIEFVSNDPRDQPSPTLLLRAGLQY
jgi:hypothetical protein